MFMRMIDERTLDPAGRRHCPAIFLAARSPSSPAGAFFRRDPERVPQPPRVVNAKMRADTGRAAGGRGEKDSLALALPENR
jgi:hypothetical protein